MGDETVVIFRKWSGNNGTGIIALFPTDYVGNGFCDSYEHIGQHGAADGISVIRRTIPASEPEYEELRTELETIGYNLKIRKRMQYTAKGRVDQ
jgi:hypothetical protein